MSSVVPQEDVAKLIRHINSTLIVRQLQSILKHEGQPTSGLKSSLQRRLATYIETISGNNDLETFKRVQAMVYRGDSTPSRPAGLPYGTPLGYTARQPPMALPSFPQPAPSNYSQNNSANSIVDTFLNRSQTDKRSPMRLHFKESPFYTILSPFCELVRCPVMSSHRHTVKTAITLSSGQAQQILADKSYRCMVYCATTDPLTPFTRETDILFPHQIEIRVNDSPVNGLNLRGLKNKPGSTRPADITDSLVKKANYRNQVELVYALTQKEYGFIVNLVKVHTVENLVRTLQDGDSIRKENVIADIIKKNEDSELVATSSIMSLKCPLSTLRIDLPVRSKFCTHIQCFDATSFLQLQQQAPTWTCPTCARSVSFKQLVVDKYFQDILNSTPKTVESVTIDTEGIWNVATETSNSPTLESSDDELDARLISDIADNNTEARFSHSDIVHPFTPTTLSGREGSATSWRVVNVGNKRPAAQVIDLTLSDDEDEPVRPTKRANNQTTPLSMNGIGLTPGGFSPVRMQTLDLPEMGANSYDLLGSSNQGIINRDIFQPDTNL